MKLLNFKFYLLIFFSFLSTTLINAQEIRTDTVYIVDTVYIKQHTEISHKKERYITRWNKLIPSYYKTQFAGSMGLISMGGGWNYGKNKQWETDVFLGFVPKYSTKHNKVTLTAKQNFIPWSVTVSDQINLKPFSTGIYLNTVFGDEFWGKQPDKYPHGYYWFSTRFRINIFIGQGWEYKLKRQNNKLFKSVTFFYEVSTNELYLYSAFTNSYLKAKDILGLSLGVKLQIL